MRIWILKAFIQKVISFLPYSQRINYLFQKYITRGVKLTDALMEDKLVHLQSHIKAFEKYSYDRKMRFTALELGTGWYPIVPLGLYLYGAKQIYTVDISPLLKKNNVLSTIQKIIEYAESAKLFSYIKSVDEQRLLALNKLLIESKTLTIEQILARCNISVMICDARKLPLPDQSIDLITSNNTFEHIYPDILKGILVEFNRVLKPGGTMCHFIDMSDHFAHLDKSITIYNFLKYSQGEWKMIDNPIQPQNRLRLPQYLEIYKQCGVEFAEIIPREGIIHQAAQIKLDRQFKKYTAKDIAISHALVITKG